MSEVYLLQTIKELRAENAASKDALTALRAVLDKTEAENERLKKQIDEFWDGLKHSYNIESREELTAIAEKCWNPPNPLLVALHHIWKRDAKLQWIPVSERLPEVKKDVLVFDEGNKLVYYAQMLCDNKFYDCENQMPVFYITHWADVTLPEGEQK